MSDDDTPDYKLQSNNFSSDDELYSVPVLVTKDLSDMLNDQLSDALIESSKRGIV